MRIFDDSREYVDLPITSSVELDAQTVEIGLRLIDTGADLLTWYPANWIGTAGTTRTARILVGPGGSPSVGEIEPGVYAVRGRVTDTPEEPTIHGFFLVVEGSGSAA